ITNSVALRGSPSSSVLKACLAAQRSAPASKPHQQRAPPCRPALACSSAFLTERHRGTEFAGLAPAETPARDSMNAPVFEPRKPRASRTPVALRAARSSSVVKVLEPGTLRPSQQE